MPAYLTDFTGIAALISAIAAIIGARKSAHTNKEMKPDHGESLKDIVHSIDDKVDMLGHQIGEIRREEAITHEDMLERIRRLEHTN